MKKILLPTLVLLAFASFLQAQTISFSNMNRSASFVDTFYAATSASVSVATPGSGQIWDYSNLVPSGTFGTETYYNASDSSSLYPGALQFFNKNLFTPSGLTIPGAEFTSLNANGWHVLGFFLQGASESLTAFTGGAGDVLDIPQQRLIYSDSLFYLKFPVTAQSTWTSFYKRQVAFNLTVASSGLNATPGVFQNYTSQTRTVLGSGQIIIPDENGNAMPAVPALMIEVTQTEIDSVFLGGAPAPPALMSVFGLTQGITFNSKYVLFYPLNNVESPIMGYNLDASGSLTGLYYRPKVGRKANSIGLAQLDLINTNVYPNPMLQGGVLNIDLSATADLAAIKIYNIQGQQVAEYKTSENNTQNLSITPNLGQGIYFISLVNQDGAELSRTKLQVL